MRGLQPILERVRQSSAMAQDIALAIAVGLTTLLTALSADGSSSSFGASTTPGSVAGFALLFASAGLLIFRRRWPVRLLEIATVLQMVIWTIGFRDTMLASTVLIAGAGYYGGAVGRRRATQSAVILTAWTLFGFAIGSAPFLAVPVVGFYAAFAVIFGRYVASQESLALATNEILDEAERRRVADGQRHRLEERNRLARDLHDVVAHNLSVVVVQAAAAQRVRDPETVVEYLQLIEQSARLALDEMREVVGALRTGDDPEWTPTQSLDDIDQLIHLMEEAGLTINTEIRVPTGLPLPILVSGYRLLQESLTNSLKHSGRGSTVAVSIAEMNGELKIEVADDGRGTPDELGDGEGHGLQGMRERVDLLGGSISSGPRPVGGFEVAIKLPIGERVA